MVLGFFDNKGQLRRKLRFLVEGFRDNMSFGYLNFLILSLYALLSFLRGFYSLKLGAAGNSSLYKFSGSPKKSKSRGQTKAKLAWDSAYGALRSFRKQIVISVPIWLSTSWPCVPYHVSQYGPISVNTIYVC